MQFSKMHGLGNDFMVIDGVTQNVFLTPDIIRQLSDRHRGIGFDQLLLVEPPYDPELDFHYRIFNADGSEVSQCGNGARCFARFVTLKGLTNKPNIHVSTAKGKMVLSLKEDGKVRVNMGTRTSAVYCQQIREKLHSPYRPTNCALRRCVYGQPTLCITSRKY